MVPNHKDCICLIVDNLAGLGMTSSKSTKINARAILAKIDTCERRKVLSIKNTKHLLSMYQEAIEHFSALEDTKRYQEIHDRM